MESPEIEKDPLFLKLEEILKKYDSSLEGLDFQLPSFQPPETSKNYFPDDIVAIELISPALPDRLEVTTHVTPAIRKPGSSENASVLIPASAGITAGPGQLRLEKDVDIIASPHADNPAITQLPLPVRERRDEKPHFLKEIAQDLPQTKRPVIKKEVGSKPLPAFFYRSIVAVCFVLGGAYWIWSAYVSSSWIVSLPFKDPLTLSLNGDRVFSFDSKRGYLYAISALSGKVKSKIPLACNGALGLAVAERNLWCLTMKGDVKRYAETESRGYVLKRIYPMGTDKLSSLYSDGEYLWGADSKNGKIYQYLISQSLTGTLLMPVNRFALSQVSPLGLYVSGRILWVLDSGSRRILRFKLTTGGPKAQDFFDLNSALKNTGSVASFTTDGETLWVLTQSPPEIHRLDLKLLPHSSSL